MHKSLRCLSCLLALSLIGAGLPSLALAAPPTGDDTEGPSADDPGDDPGDADAPDDADAADEGEDVDADAPDEGEDADADAPDDAEAPAADEPAPDAPEASSSAGMAAPDASEDNPDAKPVDVGHPKQGSEARPPKKKIQIPVDIGDKHSITYTSLLAPRINPLGLEERLWIGYQYRLYDKNKTILNGSNIGVFFRPVVSPAIALMGATLQIQPAAVLRFRATYSWVAYFGTFQYMQSYQSPYDDFSETRLDAQADATDDPLTNYATTGHQIELEALLQARYKELVIRSTTTADYNILNLRGDDDLFYAVRVEAMAPNRGWILYNDTDVVWLHDFKTTRHPSLLLGARASTIMPFYPERVYEEGDVIENPNGPQFRLGPEIGYIFYDRPDRFPRFNRPTLLLLPQWNILHRWRTGRDVSTAFPTIIMAFVFTGQLWGRN